MVVAELLRLKNLDPSNNCLTINGSGTRRIDYTVFGGKFGKIRKRLGNGSYKYSSDPNRQRHSERYQEW